MGWVWRDGEEESEGGKIVNSQRTGGGGGDAERCSTRKTVKTQCKTEEVEPARFLLKCEKTEQILRDCVGRPTEVIQDNKEYTEEDVTDQMKSGSLSVQSPDMGPFDFPGLRGDIEAIERNLLGGLNRFFEAAEEMKNGIFDAFGSGHVFDGEFSSRSSARRGVPIEDHPRGEASQKIQKSGEFDISGLAKDV